MRATIYVPDPGSARGGSVGLVGWAPPPASAIDRRALRPALQLPPIHLPQMRPRQVVDEDDLPRMLVGGELLADPGFELVFEPGASLPGFAHDHEGARLDQTLLVGDPYHRALGHRRVADEAGLDLAGDQPAAADLEHVVGPA